MRAGLLVGLTMTVLMIAGCGGQMPSDAPQPLPMDTLRDSGEAVARVYGTPIPGLPAQHTWFVIKRAGSQDFHRWEVFLYWAEPYGYVFKDLYAPEADLGAGGTHVIAEIVGSEAEPMIDCIEDASINYPCRDYYVFFPGPNSDSYTQWVLNKCGWNVALPADVIGKDVQCPFGE